MAQNWHNVTLRTEWYPDSWHTTPISKAVSISRLPGFCFVCCWWKLNPFLAPGLIRFVTCLTTSAALTARSQSQANNKRASLSLVYPHPGSVWWLLLPLLSVTSYTPFWRFYARELSEWQTLSIVEISKDGCALVFLPPHNCQVVTW